MEEKNKAEEALMEHKEMTQRQKEQEANLRQRALAAYQEKDNDTKKHLFNRNVMRKGGPISYDAAPAALEVDIAGGVQERDL